MGVQRAKPLVASAEAKYLKLTAPNIAAIAKSLSNIMAQFTFLGFTDWISHFLFYLFDVNCAFWFDSDYAICGDTLTVSLESFALLLKVKLTCDQGLCPPDTHHLWKGGRNFCLASQFTTNVGSVLSSHFSNFLLDNKAFMRYTYLYKGYDKESSGLFSSKERADGENAWRICARRTLLSRCMNNGAQFSPKVQPFPALRDIKVRFFR